MGLIQKFKKLFFVALALSMITITMSGCVYTHNKSWDDMTPEEQQEAQQDFEDIKSDLEESFSGDSAEDQFAQYILNKVEQAIENEE